MCIYKLECIHVCINILYDIIQFSFYIFSKTICLILVFYNFGIFAYYDGTSKKDMLHHIVSTSSIIAHLYKHIFTTTYVKGLPGEKLFRG